MRVSASITQDLGMPAIYLHILAELLNSIGLDERDLLRRVGLDPVRLKSADVRVSQAQASDAGQQTEATSARCPGRSRNEQPHTPGRAQPDDPLSHSPGTGPERKAP